MYSPEDRLLLICARIKLDSKSTQEALALLNENLNWEYVTRNAFRNSIDPLLYKNLKTLGAGNKVPSDIFNALKGGYDISIARNLRFYIYLGSVLKLFNDAEIKVILLKGIVLAEMIYQDIGLRPMCDIDMLVQSKDWETSHEIMVNYNPYDLSWDIHSHFRGRVFSPKAIDVNKLWADRVDATIYNMKTLKLCPEHELLHLIIHGDYFKKLIWLCDIAELVRYYKENMDWRQVIDDARQCGCSDLYFFQLFSAKRLLNAPVPDDVLKALQPTIVKARAMNRLIDEWSPEQRETTIFNFSRPFKVRLLESLAFNRKEYLKKITYRLFTRIINKID